MTVTHAELELVWDTRCSLAESPLWDAQNQQIYFVDLYESRIYAYGIADGGRRSWKAPDLLGSLGLCASGRLVVALRRRVAFFDPTTGAFETLSRDIDEPPDNKFNDGKVGPDGCFWVGTLGRNGTERARTGQLYRVTPDGKLEIRADGYLTSNGLAWSADGRTMFHSDSGRLMVEAWDFDPATGAMTNWRQVVQLTEEEGHPDGAACDVDGNYWSADPKHGSLMQFTPGGELKARIKVSIPYPTMPCFAGSSLFVTSLRRNRSAEILAKYPGLGGLFRMKAPATGVEIARFADR